MSTTTANQLQQPCAWCGPYITHGGKCPKVKAITYGPDGTRFEFFLDPK